MVTGKCGDAPARQQPAPCLPPALRRRAQAAARRRRGPRLPSALIVMSSVGLRYRAVLAVQSGYWVIEVEHRLGVAAVPAQLHGFGCPVL